MKNSIDFDVKELQDSVKNLTKENAFLIDKLDDLENRSRRNNLVIFGIKESEGKEDCWKTVGDFLRFVGRDDDIGKIERCHRTPTTPPNPKNAHQRQLPRRIHIGFNSFVVKERVRKAAIDKLKSTKSQYDEQQKVFVAEDLSKRVIEKRKKKSSLFNRLFKSRRANAPFLPFLTGFVTEVRMENSSKHPNKMEILKAKLPTTFIKLHR